MGNNLMNYLCNDKSNEYKNKVNERINMAIMGLIPSNLGDMDSPTTSRDKFINKIKAVFMDPNESFFIKLNGDTYTSITLYHKWLSSIKLVYKYQALVEREEDIQIKEQYKTTKEYRDAVNLITLQINNLIFVIVRQFSLWL